MKIRKAGISDVPSIAKVTVDTWKTAYRGIIPDSYLNNLTYEEREKGWREFPFHNSFIYVAEDETEGIVGFAAAGPERTSNPVYKGELYAIYVYESFQNKGIGSSLIRSVMKEFESSGVYSVLVWVLSHSAYRRFYELHQGRQVDSQLLDMEGFQVELTAYGWPDIRGKFTS